MSEPLEAQTKEAEGNLNLDEGGKRSAQMGLHQGLAGDIGDFVDAAGKGHRFAWIIEAGGGLKLFKGFDRANNRAVLVMHGNGVDANGNFISGFVMQETDSLSGMRGFDGACDGAIFFAELTARLIAVQQTFGDARVPDDLVAEVSGDALGTVAPEDDFLLHVDNGEPGRKAIENTAADVGVVK